MFELNCIYKEEKNILSQLSFGFSIRSWSMLLLLHRLRNYLIILFKMFLFFQFMIV